MTQHNNNLSLHQHGKDVALLQSRLMTMGHTIATSEILSELFGESTQQAEGLPVTGRVDGATAQAIVSSFELDKTVIKHTPVPLHPPATLVLPAISEGVLGKPVEIVSDQQVAAGSSLFLSCGMQGEDIKHLHNELQALGYAISVEERQEALFGATTPGAVQEYGQRHTLERSGVVNEQIAVLLQRRPGLEVAPIGFGNVFTLSAV